MPFNKVPYVDGQTTIYANNMNDIQDELIRLNTAKQNAMTFDTDPTAGSSNPVTSNGVYNAISAVQTEIQSAIQTAKNYITPQMFGAKGDGINDDYQAIYDAIYYANANNKTVYIPNATYRLSHALDLSTIPFVLHGDDYRYTIKIIGENMRSTKLLFDSGVTSGIYCNGKKDSNYRRIIVSNIQIASADYPNKNYRSFDAFHIMNCPDSIIDNIWIIGGNHGLYIDINCWDTSLEYITARYCDYGIVFNGYNETEDAAGYCDNVSGKYLYFGNSRAIGLYVRGVTNGLFENLDYEISNGTACDGIVIESSNNINIKGYYVEWIRSQPAIRIKSIHDNNIQMIPKNIVIMNAKFYRCDGPNIRIEKGIFIRIDSCEQVTNYQSDSPYSIGNFLQIPNAGNLGTKFVHHIFINNCAILRWTTEASTGMLSAIIREGNAYNINPYYVRNIYNGELLINDDKATYPNAIFLKCTKSGTYWNGNLGATGSGTSGTHKITVSDSSKIFVGAYISIGNDKGLYVIRIDNNDVYVYESLSESHTDEAVTISRPTLVEI